MLAIEETEDTLSDTHITHIVNQVYWFLPLILTCKSSALTSPVTCRDTELQEFGAQSLILLALLDSA